LLQASLSAKGLEKSRNIMRLNETIREMTQRLDEYGEGLYNLTVMGEPSETAPWGWQLDGHHLIINYFVLRDQVVMTPTFMGSEPVHATSGKYAGTIVLQDEQNKGLAFMKALTSDQQKKATLNSEKTANNSLAQAFRDNLVLDFAGLRVNELAQPQRKLLLDLIQEYVGNMSEGHARVRMEEVQKHLADTYFAWIGGTADDAVFYYRIHSPVILIEFDHQTPVALPGPKVPGRIHVHSVVRTPNGNDYGKDLLRQHYDTHKHDVAHGHSLALSPVSGSGAGR
jgi:predicted nuclease of restriction endonuclease-like (RecB) superfamily